MRIGITFDLKSHRPARPGPARSYAQEEFDSPHTIDALAKSFAGWATTSCCLATAASFSKRSLPTRPTSSSTSRGPRGQPVARGARAAVLEMLGIPFTGSESTHDGGHTRQGLREKLVAAAGVAVAKDAVSNRTPTSPSWAPSIT